MGKKSRTDVTHHRSNHLYFDDEVKIQLRLRTQLSLIVPAVVYEKEGEIPSELVTVARDA